MAINIQDYETQLNSYTALINEKKNKLSQAEKDLLVAQTHLASYQEEKKKLEDECMKLTGKPISELENIIQSNMKTLEETIAKISNTSSPMV